MDKTKFTLGKFLIPVFFYNQLYVLTQIIATKVLKKNFYTKKFQIKTRYEK
jgi:hypothetical protein